MRINRVLNILKYLIYGKNDTAGKWEMTTVIN